MKSWHVNITGTAETILPELPGSDLIITQILDGGGERALASDVLERYTGKLVFLPPFAFAGFHPDLIVPETGRNGYLPSPVGLSHSALVIAAFLHGIPEERVAKLFNLLVYEAGRVP